MKKIYLILFINLLIFNLICIDEINAQEVITSGQEVRQSLKELTVKIPNLNDTLSMSVSDLSLQDFLRGIANYSHLNFDIATNIDHRITANFKNVKVIDVLEYVCTHYQLKIINFGSILSISSEVPKPPDFSSMISYHKDSDQLSVDVYQQRFVDVIKYIVSLTGKNIIPEPGLENKILTAFFRELSYNEAIEKLAFTNNLKVTFEGDSMSIFSAGGTASMPPQTNENLRPQNMQGRQPRDPSRGEYLLEVNGISGDSISIRAVNAPLDLVIKEACQRMGISFFVNGKLEELQTFEINMKPFDVFIHDLFFATKYTYYKENGLYYFGLRDNAFLKETKLVMLHNRTISKITEFLPKAIFSEVEIIEFVEQNSLIITGDYDKVNKAEKFILSIDKPIPVILIEVIIIDMMKSFGISTGIEAGIGDQPIETGGVIFPGVDVQLSGNTLNNILQSFNIPGLKEIGVKPNVYLLLQAMESQGLLNIRSTPKLSTLNGHEAVLIIGKTEYYEEENSNIVGNVGTTISTYRTYKPVEAELSITITPIVSGNNYITLEIVVNQSDFTERIKVTAPPGIVRREFRSIIRVQNQETVILGGLEESRKSDTASGTPLLSRIPLLKWLFSSRNNKNSSSRLNVFIKPTIID